MTIVNESKIMLSVSNLGVSYIQRISFRKKINFWSIKDISFEIYKGETVGLVGSNGAGKSTLLRTLANIIEANRGFVNTYGHSISLLGLLMGFGHRLSGRVNAIMGGMMQGMSRTEIEAKLENVLEFSELGDFFDQPVCNYSAGMRARLRFAIAMQANPDILLVDELLGVGDTSFKIKSSRVIKSRVTADQTAIVVSHDTDIISELCDRVIWIEDGVIKMSGKAKEICQLYEKSQIAKVDK